MKDIGRFRHFALLIVLVAIGLTIATAVSAYRRHQPGSRDIPASTQYREGVSRGDKELDRQLNICRGC